MNYSIFILRQAQKELAQLPKESYERIRDFILSLGKDPRPRGCLKLTGRNGWRFRLGKYRIIYEIDDDKKSVTILSIGHRRDIYR